MTRFKLVLLLTVAFSGTLQKVAFYIYSLLLLPRFSIHPQLAMSNRDSFVKRWNIGSNSSFTTSPPNTFFSSSWAVHHHLPPCHGNNPDPLEQQHPVYRSQTRMAFLLVSVWLAHFGLHVWPSFVMCVSWTTAGSGFVVLLPSTTYHHHGSAGKGGPRGIDRI